MPSRPRVVFEEKNKGVYEIDGLYAGYGHTLGNSLRRIVLSSIYDITFEKMNEKKLNIALSMGNWLLL